MANGWSYCSSQFSHRVEIAKNDRCTKVQFRVQFSRIQFSSVQLVRYERALRRGSSSSSGPIDALRCHVSRSRCPAGRLNSPYTHSPIPNDKAHSTKIDLVREFNHPSAVLTRKQYLRRTNNNATVRLNCSLDA